MTTAAHGRWPSPLGASDLVADAALPSGLCEDGDAVWWSESRPSEGGRTVVMCWSDGAATEAVGSETNVRSRVHEYGGGAWTAADGVLYYVELADQRIWMLEPGAEPVALTSLPERPAAERYADLRRSPDGRHVVCVRERHGDGGPVNDLVAVAIDGSGVDQLAGGADFYSSPRLSPDGRALVWIQWDHPNMPWDATELWTASFEAGRTENIRRLAGDSEALQQPSWDDHGRLYVISDRSGSWQVHAVDDAGIVEEPVSAANGEIGVPPWVFGTCSYRVGGGGSMRRVETRPGVGDRLVEPDGRVQGYTEVVTIGRRSEIAATWETEHAVYVDGERVSRSAPERLSSGYLGAPEHIDASGPGGEVHAWYYAPANPNAEAPEGELPPLLVVAHGGPTGAARTGLQLGIRYWTSRGFAVADVNYRGSTGYGRAYRQKLDGLWGVADVEDCLAVARHLAAEGLVDPGRLGIRGSSAGGLTVLGALAFGDTFTAGVSRYGVADLEALAKDTHKFEARYLDRLVGPYPDDADRYRSRSPIHHVGSISAPMLVLQGLDDVIVPPSQAEAIVVALRGNEVPVEYIAFDGESHGFRRAETIITALESELAFFRRTWTL